MHIWKSILALQPTRRPKLYPHMPESDFFKID
jgi:hypothetical protein